MSLPGILFESAEERAAAASAAEPECFHDLSLGRVVDAVTAGREESDLKPFFYVRLKTLSAISYRHEVWKDLENRELLTSVETFTARMRDSRRMTARAAKAYYPREKQRWRLDAAQAYVGAVTRLQDDLRRLGPASRAFRAFSESLAGYASSEGFQGLRADEVRTRDALSRVRYRLHLSGDSVEVDEIESEAEFTPVVEATFAKFREGAAKDYRIKRPEPSEMSHVDAAILDLVAHLRPEPFLALDEFCARWESFADERLTAFDREVQFYLAYLRYVDGLRAQGLPFSLPVMSDESKKTVCRDAFDPALADVLAKKKQVPVLNDLALSGVERILVITGPNQGGKTTYARLFGQLAYLAGLGLPVPAREASLFLCDRVFTHFERQEGAGTGRGKLQDELLRLRGVLATATPKSVLILNEMFSSTSVEDARELSRWIMERLSRLDLLCASTTFLDELSVLNEKTVSVVAGIDADDPARRTFRLERRPADGLAYATALAEKHRLTYARLKERLKR